MRLRKELIGVLVLTAVLALLPLGIAGNAFVMQILILALVYGVVGSSWDLIMGYAGVFTFAQVALFGIGAYTTAILTTAHGLSPWLGILAGSMVAGIVGVLLGLPCLRLKGSYVALLTFGLHMLFAAFLVSSLGVRLGTGGSMGIIGIPPLSLFGHPFNPLQLGPWYYVALAFFSVSLLIIYRVIFSHTGTAFIALRDHQERAQSLGINAYRYKLLVFAITSVLTGAVGAFYAHYTGVVSASMLSLNMFVLLMVMQVAGGLGIFPGTALAAFPILFLDEYLSLYVDTYSPIIFGAAVVLLVLFLPKGILGTFGPRIGSTPLRRLSRTLRSKATSEQAAEGIVQIPDREQTGKTAELLERKQ
jgi:branched-chain amino acid transport system permease protein